MGWVQWFTVGCLSLAVLMMPFMAHWLRQAAKFNKITQKIRAHEPLTDREQHMLDKAKS